MFETVMSWFGLGTLSEEAFEAERQRLLAKAPVPVVWLFGKTGSGKTSIIKFLTRADDAAIGNGFKPQTQTSRQYDFPASDEPIMRFLDTRGLGEVRYDPAEDLATFGDSTHVVLVTVRALDHALEEIVEPLKRIRKARPHRPILLALTCLHEAYPGEQHPLPDPFANTSDPAEAAGAASRVPESLARSIAVQAERFAGLADGIVPIDLTPPIEGFHEPEFGGDRLKENLLAMLPAAFRSALLQFDEAIKPLRDLHERQAMPYIMGYSSLAATAAAVPIPWIDIPVVLGIQSHLVYQVASFYGQTMQARELQAMVAAVGGRVLARMAVRELLKFIPFVGSAANAALSFAYTYALGKACCWYYAELRAGHAPRPEELEQVWSEQLLAAAELWKRKN